MLADKKTARLAILHLLAKTGRAMNNEELHELTGYPIHLVGRTLYAAREEKAPLVRFDGTKHIFIGPEVGLEPLPHGIALPDKALDIIYGEGSRATESINEDEVKKPEGTGVEAKVSIDNGDEEIIARIANMMTSTSKPLMESQMAMALDIDRNTLKNIMLDLVNKGYILKTELSEFDENIYSGTKKTKDLLVGKKTKKKLPVNKVPEITEDIDVKSNIDNNSEDNSNKEKGVNPELEVELKTEYADAAAPLHIDHNSVDPEIVQFVMDNKGISKNSLVQLVLDKLPLFNSIVICKRIASLIDAEVIFKKTINDEEHYYTQRQGENNPVINESNLIQSVKGSDEDIIKNKSVVNPVTDNKIGRDNDNIDYELVRSLIAKLEDASINGSYQSSEDVTDALSSISRYVGRLERENRKWKVLATNYMKGIQDIFENKN